MEEITMLIQSCIENKKYISCLEDIYVLFEKYNLPFSERNTIMKSIYDYNQKLHKVEQEKNSKLEKIKKKKTTHEKISDTVVIIPTKKETKKNEPLQLDISYYIEKIEKMTEYGELEKILPVRDDEQFNNIIDMLVVNLYGKKVELINFIHEQQLREKGIYEMFDDDLEILDSKIEMLLDYKIDNGEIQDVKTKGERHNKIVFLKNSNNLPLIMSYIKDNEENYKKFLELINSIIDGTFKNFRVFVNSEKIINMMEVRFLNSRILFSRLNSNTYVVMAAFVKKCDTDLRHRNLVENISSIYQSQKETLLTMINNEEFMKQEEFYLEELIKELKGKEKVNLK